MYPKYRAKVSSDAHARRSRVIGARVEPRKPRVYEGSPWQSCERGAGVRAPGGKRHENATGRRREISRGARPSGRPMAARYVISYDVTEKRCPRGCRWLTRSLDRSLTILARYVRDALLFRDISRRSRLWPRVPTLSREARRPSDERTILPPSPLPPSPARIIREFATREYFSTLNYNPNRADLRTLITSSAHISSAE